MITSGPWEGYTKGQQANAFLNKGYEYDASTNTWTLDEDDPITGLIKSGAWAGYTEGEKSAKLASLGWTQDDTDQWKPPVDPTDAEEAGATVDVRISQLNYPYGGFEVKRSRDGRDVITVTADELSLLLSSGAFKGADAVDEPTGWINEENFTQGTTGMTVVDGQVQLPMSLINSMVSTGMINIEAEVAEGTIPVSVQHLKDLGATEVFLGDYDILGTGEDAYIRLTPDAFFQRFPRDNPYAPGEEPEGELPVTVAHMERLGMSAPEEYDWTVQGDAGSEYVMLTQSEWEDVAPGMLMFSPTPEAVAVPSGIMKDDFPELETALGPNVKIGENGEYWFTPDDINAYGRIAELREDTDVSLRELIEQGPYEEFRANWPPAMYSDIQNRVSTIVADETLVGIETDDLFLRVIIERAPFDEEYARVLAKYLGRDVHLSAGEPGTDDYDPARAGKKVDHLTGKVK